MKEKEKKTYDNLRDSEKNGTRVQRIFLGVTKQNENVIEWKTNLYGKGNSADRTKRRME